MTKRLELTGQKFGKLIVIEFVPLKRTHWRCLCDCGKEKVIQTSHLTSGHTKSCGCLFYAPRPRRPGANAKYHPRITSARAVWNRIYSDGNLSFDDFYQLSQQNCHYCGGEPSNFKLNSDSSASVETKLLSGFTYNGLDRINSSKPHDLDNVIPCCKYCNYAKRDRGYIEYLNWIKLAYTTMCCKE